MTMDIIMFMRMKTTMVEELLKALSKASALWADAFYKLICPYVCVCVCSLLRFRLNIFLHPLPEVRCPELLEIQNPWGKSNEKKCE